MADLSREDIRALAQPSFALERVELQNDAKRIKITFRVESRPIENLPGVQAVFSVVYEDDPRQALIGKLDRVVDGAIELLQVQFEELAAHLANRP